MLRSSSPAPIASRSRRSVYGLVAPSSKMFSTPEPPSSSPMILPLKAIFPDFWLWAEHLVRLIFGLMMADEPNPHPLPPLSSAGKKPRGLETAHVHRVALPVSCCARDATTSEEPNRCNREVPHDNKNKKQERKQTQYLTRFGNLHTSSGKGRESFIDSTTNTNLYLVYNSRGLCHFIYNQKVSGI